MWPTIEQRTENNRMRNKEKIYQIIIQHTLELVSEPTTVILVKSSISQISLAKRTNCNPVRTSGGDFPR